jgi:hypothetical protein
MLHVMGGAAPREPAPDSSGARQRKAAGAWVGYLIFGLFLLFLIVLDAEYAYQRQWADIAGATVFILIYLIVPTRGAKWLRRVLRDMKSPKSTGG